MDAMLAVVGAGLIGAAIVVLLALIGLARTARWRWLASAGVAERITAGLVGCLAVGMVFIELHRRALPVDTSDSFEVGMLLATLFGFVLMWSWFQLCGARRPETDQAHHSSG